MGNRKRTLKEELASRILYDDRSGKDLERHILEGFLARLQLASYKVEESEKPDFRITFGDGQVVVGCELTMFNSDSPFEKQKGGSMERRLHSQWKKFSTSLRKELDENGLLYIYGAIHFVDSSLNIFDQFDSKKFQRELVQLCLKISVTSGETKTVDIFSKTEYTILSKFVQRIYLRDCYPETGILWWCGHLQSGEVEDPTNSILRVIETKVTKASSYKWDRVTEKWLLIYAASTGLTDLAFVQDDLGVAHKISRIPFDVVFLWNKFSEDIQELYPHFRIVVSGEENALYVKRLPSVISRYLKSE